MYHLSRFNSVDGKPDQEQVENWAETFFFNLMTVLNAFFSYVDVEEALDRMKRVPFADLVKEELEDENEEIKNMAIRKVNELAEIELQFMESYIVKD